MAVLDADGDRGHRALAVRVAAPWADGCRGGSPAPAPGSGHNGCGSGAGSGSAPAYRTTSGAAPLGPQTVGRAARDDEIVARVYGDVAEDASSVPEPSWTKITSSRSPFGRKSIRASGGGGISTSLFHISRRRPVIASPPAAFLTSCRGVAVLVCVGHPLVAHDRVERAQLLRAAGRREVVQDRLVPVKPSRPITSSVISVPFSRYWMWRFGDVSEAQVEGHARRIPPAQGRRSRLRASRGDNGHRAFLPVAAGRSDRSDCRTRPSRAASFWTGAPKLLAAFATILGSIVALTTVLVQAGVIGSERYQGGTTTAVPVPAYGLGADVVHRKRRRQPKRLRDPRRNAVSRRRAERSSTDSWPGRRTRRATSAS